MKAIAVIVAILMGTLAPGLAVADNDDCKVPMAQWQPREAVEQMAKARGWTVRRIKIDDGCFEIRGQDENGREIEAKVDPASLAVIRVKQKRGEHGRNRDDEEDGARRSGRSGPEGAPEPAGVPPSNGLFQGGAAPKAEVK
ncbi:PepSY domain-containing protein [Bradyrhizobium sp. SZCCHNR1047]|uniref:PepSY domain-containing protein n=1 Tax=Bradyrhizobium sp. SZCCHNR1047 TaxID=3057354 RepID=UPI002917080D|nr:PepSY domain-containing protein [Bradyrhizobium sp. SZCCHNR1047]